MSGNVGIYAQMIPICNEGLASQQRPNVSTGGRLQSRCISDGAVKDQKRQTPRSEDSSLPSRERLMVLWSKVEEGDRGRICAAEPGVCDQSSSRLVATLAVCLALCYTSIHPHACLGEENTIFMVWPKYHPEKASVCCPLPSRYIH